METINDNKAFPIVWAIRKKKGHTGVFSEDETRIQRWYSDTVNVEMAKFNIVDNWQGLCAFFDGWQSDDQNRANKIRENIFDRNNYKGINAVLPQQAKTR